MTHNHFATTEIDPNCDLCITAQVFAPLSDAEKAEGDALMAALRAEPMPTFDYEAEQIRRSEARWNR